MDEEKIQKIINKWSPIMSSLGVTKEKKIRCLSMYAEQHYLMKNKQYNEIEPIQESLSQNLLPLSMKTASMLTNLDRHMNKGTMFLSETSVNPIQFKVKIMSDNHDCFNGQAFIETYEDILRHEVAKELNKKLKFCSEVTIHCLCSNLEIQQTDGNYMVWSADIKFGGTREDKLKRILKDDIEV